MALKTFKHANISVLYFYLYQTPEKLIQKRELEKIELDFSMWLEKDFARFPCFSLRAKFGDLGVLPNKANESRVDPLNNSLSSSNTSRSQLSFPSQNEQICCLISTFIIHWIFPVIIEQIEIFAQVIDLV